MAPEWRQEGLPDHPAPSGFSQHCADSDWLRPGYRLFASTTFQLGSVRGGAGIPYLLSVQPHVDWTALGKHWRWTTCISVKKFENVSSLEAAPRNPVHWCRFLLAEGGPFEWKTSKSHRPDLAIAWTREPWEAPCATYLPQFLRCPWDAAPNFPVFLVVVCVQTFQGVVKLTFQRSF